MKQSLKRIVGDALREAKRNPSRSAHIFAQTSERLRWCAMLPANAKLAEDLLALANDFAAASTSAPPATTDDFDQRTDDTAAAFEAAGPAGDLEVEAARRQIEIAREELEINQVSIAPGSFEDSTRIGNSGRFKYNPSQADITAGIHQADTLLLWQGSKRETQAVTIDIGVSAFAPSGTNARPYGELTYGTDGYTETVRVDVGRGTRVVLPASYLSVSIGMDPPATGVTPGVMSIGAHIGCFAAPSAAPITRTVYVDDLSRVISVNNVTFDIPRRAQLLLPPQCSEADVTAEVDFLDSNGTVISSVVFVTGSVVSAIPIPNDAVQITLTNTSTTGVVTATFRLIFQLDL